MIGSVGALIRAARSVGIEMLLACAVSISMLAAADATTIIGYRTTDFAIVGADSKVTVAGTTQRLSACKIDHEGNTAWASADLWKTNDFDLNQIAESSFKSASSWYAALQNFDARTSKQLVVVLESLAKTKPEQYRGYMSRSKSNRAIVETLFIGLVQDEIRMSLRTFEANFDRRKRIVVTAHDRNCLGECTIPLVVYVGRDAAIQSAIKNNKNVWMELTAANTIRKLITIQAEATPDSVGPPIAILKLTHEGLQWIDQANCPSL